MVGKKKQLQSDLGRTIIKNRFGKQQHRDNDSFLHTTDMHQSTDWCRLPVRSMTEENNLTEFFTLADLAGAEYDAERQNVKIADSNGVIGVLSAAERRHIDDIQEENVGLLKIPRRPTWNTTMTAEELDRLEKDSFLNWRRKLAQLENVEHLVITPFEKNLEFWRQLWRVVERSDVIVQIVDARNPLLFRCEDLEAYVHEVGPEKLNLILINKSDLLTETQRESWTSYFTSIGVRAIFWSAKLADESCEQEEDDSEGHGDEEEEEDSSEDEQEEGLEGIHEEKIEDENTDTDAMATAESPKEILPNTTEPAPCTSSTSQSDNMKIVDTSVNSPHLLSVSELIQLLKTIYTGPKKKGDMVTVGLVGYPNVGKSSTLNAIFQTKKAAVSATPGRTKHFQTLHIDHELLLCDCPGLVMPSFAHSRAELIVSSILSIDHMRDCLPPIALICNEFNRRYLECRYGITLPNPKEGEDENRPPTARELLASHAYMHGFMTTKGNPNLDRSSRQILKDYVNGRLLYSHPPPGVSTSVYMSVSEISEQRRIERYTAAQRRRAERELAGRDGRPITDFDKKFFLEKVIGSGLMGRKPRPGETITAEATIGKKKHHMKHNKKDKLRRTFRHLDVHD